jgi:hypothetical protein
MAMFCVLLIFRAKYVSHEERSRALTQAGDQRHAGGYSYIHQFYPENIYVANKHLSKRLFGAFLIDDCKTKHFTQYRMQENSP